MDEISQRLLDELEEIEVQEAIDQQVLSELSVEDLRWLLQPLDGISDRKLEDNPEACREFSRRWWGVGGT